MTLKILTPKSPRWDMFVRLLDSTMTEASLPEGKWPCRHDHRYAEAVLAELGGIDIDGTLRFFEKHGGYCDCEILFNVDPDVAAA